MPQKEISLIDLFCGAGGLSLGFELANFRVDLAVEIEENYFKAYKRNHPNNLLLNEDITELDCKKIAGKFLKNVKIDGIIGGPPCIGFSSVGNRKQDDPRNMLVFFFIKWVEYFKPTFFVMENVKGILTMSKGQVVEKIIKMYNDIGYKCKMEVLLAAEYGVPQLRERVFFIGTKDSSIRSLKINKTNKNKITMKSNSGKNMLPPYLTVRDALSDILEINPLTKQRVEDSTINYNRPPLTQYQEYLRKDSTELYDHFAPNHSELMRRRMSFIDQGMNHSSLPKEFQLKGGYPNIYGRLHLDSPADTITGNCGCVSAPGRFIHPTQDRAISIREAARLQSFPDKYKFCGTMRDKYKQIGNAVPPLMAFAVAKSIQNMLWSKTSGNNK